MLDCSFLVTQRWRRVSTVFSVLCALEWETTGRLHAEMYVSHELSVLAFNGATRFFYWLSAVCSGPRGVRLESRMLLAGCSPCFSSPTSRIELGLLFTCVSQIRLLTEGRGAKVYHGSHEKASVPVRDLDLADPSAIFIEEARNTVKRIMSNFDLMRVMIM